MQDIVARPEQFGLPRRPGGEETSLWNLGDGDWKCARDEDVAVLRLEHPGVIQSLHENGWSILTFDDIAFTDDGDGEYLIYGWPAQHVAPKPHKNRPGLRLEVKPELLEVRRHPSPPTDGHKYPLTGSDLFFTWPERDDVPNLRGISGSPIWRARHNEPLDGIYHATKAFKVVGVQWFASHGSYVRGTSWDVVAGIILAFEDDR
jgi:hypothetical protein